MNDFEEHCFYNHSVSFIKTAAFMPSMVFCQRDMHSEKYVISFLFLLLRKVAFMRYMISLFFTLAYSIK